MEGGDAQEWRACAVVERRYLQARFGGVRLRWFGAAVGFAACFATCLSCARNMSARAFVLTEQTSSLQMVSAMARTFSARHGDARSKRWSLSEDVAVVMDATVVDALVTVFDGVVVGLFGGRLGRGWRR